MSAVAVETPVELPRGLRVVDGPPAPRPGPRFLEEAPPGANEDVEPWEIHSELALVSPDVRRRALELLPEREPDAFLARTSEPTALSSGSVDEGRPAPGLPAAAGGYALWRLRETARSALFALGGVVTLAALAEALH